MNRSKFGLALFTIFVVLFTGVFAIAFEPPARYLPLIIMGGALWTGVKQWRRLGVFARQTYPWYKQAYPQHVGEGWVQCHSCGSRHIQVRALLEHSYQREHFCSQCGTTLYYSAEPR